jgi:uncharacterized protein (TIGR00661 family)
MAAELMQRGHEVKIFASHAAYHVLRPKMPDVTEIPGMVLVYENNKVRILPTVRSNAETWRRKGEVVRRLKAELTAYKPDLVITDFEPFLPAAARELEIPFVSLDHQHVIPGLKLRPPARCWGEYIATLAVVHLTHRGECANLVSSYYHPSAPYQQRYRYFGPILRPEIKRLKTEQREHVLVYQTSASFTNLPDLLKDIPLEFRFYAFPCEGRIGNCVFKPRNHPDFFEDLASCSWVLTNGGYTLISESLYLGKPVLSVPVEGQFEQWINAHFLEKLGFGRMLSRREVTSRAIREFVTKREQYAAAIRRQSFDSTSEAVEALLSFL